MEYTSILNRIEEQKKDEQLSAKLFRYAGLIHAIEFFSQRLNSEQIIDAAFDFVNELLMLERSAIFVLHDNNYVLTKLKGYDSKITWIKAEEPLNRLAMLHGTLINDRAGMERYFEAEVLNSFKTTTVIPLIIENILYGFIFVSNKTDGELNSDDYIISEALMKLFNNALENYKRYEELQKANKELDEKIFNLFAINHSSKALLSELSLEILLNLSIDIFSELTQSSVTGFILFDERLEKYTLKVFKDVFRKDSDIQVSLTSNKFARVDINRIIINVSKQEDALYFNSIFKEGLDALKDLKPAYVVLLVKNGKILGFVTLGETVTGNEFKNSIFELIESMAASTFIAISNAQFFKQVNDQKRIIHNKLERLVSLNHLMRNINSSLKVETLIEMTLKTLEISFEVDKALMALYDQEEDVFKITGKLNIDTPRKEIKPTKEWKKVLEGDMVFEASEDEISKYIGASMAKEVGDCSGILIVPVFIERIDIEVLGVIIVFKYKKIAINEEENLLTLETIAGHIAPVLSNLFTLEEQKRFSLPNYIELFKKDLKDEITEAQDCLLDLQVIHVTDARDFIFKDSNIAKSLKKGFAKVYPFSFNNIFIIINGKEKNALKKIKKATGVEEVKVKILTFGVDFSSYQDFFKQF